MSPFRKAAEETVRAVLEAPDLDPGADELIRRLEEGDPDQRREAAVALGGLPPGPELDRALTVLMAHAALERDVAVLRAVTAQLAQHDRPDVVDGLVGYLAVDDATLRNAVVQALAGMPVSAAARMPALILDPDPDVRIHAVMLLAGLRVPEVEGWLTELVTGDPDPNVTAAAAGELFELAGPACEPALLQARDRFPEDPFIRYVVTRVQDSRQRQLAERGA